VKWFSDSQTACSIARVGSMKKDLHNIAIRMYTRLCVDHKVELEIDHEWIPRTGIQKADYISKLIDIDGLHFTDLL
jgi:hypothetical protein